MNKRSAPSLFALGQLTMVRGEGAPSFIVQMRFRAWWGCDYTMGGFSEDSDDYRRKCVISEDYEEHKARELKRSRKAA